MAKSIFVISTCLTILNDRSEVFAGYLFLKSGQLSYLITFGVVGLLLVYQMINLICFVCTAKHMSKSIKTHILFTDKFEERELLFLHFWLFEDKLEIGTHPRESIEKSMVMILKAKRDLACFYE